MKAKDYFSLAHPLATFRSRMSLRAREKMFARFMDSMRPREDHSVLDVGVTPDTALADSNFFEKMYPYPERICAVSIEDVSGLENIFPEVDFLTVEPGPLPFSDNSFDLLFCSAVLEHVGDFDSQKAFLAEIIRVSKRFFFTTPNRWYPIDFHTILPLVHWLPKPLHRRVLSMVGHDFLALEENLNLCSATDVTRMMPASVSYDMEYLWFLGMPSNILVYGKSGQ